MKKKGIALFIAGVAITAAIVTPIYINHVKNQALERQAEWESNAAKVRLQPPKFGCVDGHYRVTDDSSAIMVSIPVWTDHGIVECNGDSYSINGKSVSSEEVQVMFKSNDDNLCAGCGIHRFALDYVTGTINKLLVKKSYSIHGLGEKIATHICFTWSNHSIKNAIINLGHSCTGANFLQS